MYKQIKEAELLQRLEELQSLFSDFCSVGKYYPKNKTKINMSALQDVIVRVHKRGHYYKVFHHNMKFSEYKETALYCYWLIKLRPFWADPTIEEAEKINEKFALHLYLSIVKKYYPGFSEEDGLDLKHTRELLYSFRYRDLTKEAIILMLEPYYYKHLKDQDRKF